MGKTRTLFLLFYLVFFTSCAVMAQENPADMFIALFQKYEGRERKSIIRDIEYGEGTGILIYDIQNKISDDLFLTISLPSTMGNTIYTVYNKSTEAAWYFHKKVYFYEAPFSSDNAEVFDTYFKFTSDLPYVFNNATKEYDIQKDTNEFQAIRDFGSLKSLVEYVQELVYDT